MVETCVETSACKAWVEPERGPSSAGLQAVMCGSKQAERQGRSLVFGMPMHRSCLCQGQACMEKRSQLSMTCGQKSLVMPGLGVEVVRFFWDPFSADRALMRAQTGKERMDRQDGGCSTWLHAMMVPMSVGQCSLCGTILFCTMCGANSM